MKRNIALTLMIALSLITVSGCANEKAANVIDEFTVVETAEVPEGLDTAHGLYSDPSDSISEMKKTTSHIVYGQVESVEESSEVAVAVSFKVQDSYKGTLEVDKSINITQVGRIGSDDVLVEGNHYVLFVNPNSTEEPSYFIRAGVEGVFGVDLETEEIYSNLGKWHEDLAKAFKVKNDGEVRIKLNKFKKLIK